MSEQEQKTPASDVAATQGHDQEMVRDLTAQFVGNDEAAVASASASASASVSAPVHPPNALEKLVGENLQRWMEEEEEEEGSEWDGGEEEDSDSAAADEPESAPEQAMTSDAGMSDVDAAAAVPSRSRKRGPSHTTPSHPPRSSPIISAADIAQAAAAATAAEGEVARAIPVPAPAQHGQSLPQVPVIAAVVGKQKKRKKTRSSILADDSMELAEILGADDSTLLGRSSRPSARGRRALMRRGQGRGRLSQLTPEMERRMGEANSAYVNKDLEKAVDICLQIIKAEPKALGPYHLLGLVYEERGEMSKAIEAFMLAALLSQRDWDLWKRVAQMASENNQLKAAVYCWTRILNAEPDNQELRWARSMAYFEMGEFQKSLDCFRYLLKHSRHDPAILRQVASCYSHLEKPRSGVNVLMKYIEWFKKMVRKNERRERILRGEEDESDESAGEEEEDRDDGDGGAWDIGDEEPALKRQRRPIRRLIPERDEDDPTLHSEDLDINLVNILCELLLDLRQYEEVVECIDELLPHLHASIRASMPPADLQEGEDAPEPSLPLDLHTKLGVAYLHLGEDQQAQEIFAPLLAKDAPSVYDVETWGDLYVDVATAHVDVGLYDQASILIDHLLTCPTWHTQQVRLLQAQCAYHSATVARQQQLEAIRSSATEQQSSSVSEPIPPNEIVTEKLLNAVALYEKVHTEDSENIDVRLALSELYTALNRSEDASDILKGVDIESHQAAAQMGMLGPRGGRARGGRTKQDNGTATTKDGSKTGDRSRDQPISTRVYRQAQGPLRLFHQECELLLQAGKEDEFLRFAMAPLADVIETAYLDLEGEDEERIPYEMIKPMMDNNQAGQAASTAQQSTSSESVAMTINEPGMTDDAGSGSAAGPDSSANVTLSPPSIPFPNFPIDSTYSTTAQRLSLQVEFLRPASAAIKLLYARGRLNECLWMIHHLGLLVTRYLHAYPVTLDMNGALTGTATSTKMAELGIRATVSVMGSGGGGVLGESSRPSDRSVDMESIKFSAQARQLQLGLQYISSGIFIRLNDPWRAFQCLRQVYTINPYSFLLAAQLNRLLHAISYPHSALKSLERLLVKHPHAWPIRLLLGHGSLHHANHELAWRHYLFVHTKIPNEPLPLLLMGVVQLQCALKKTNLYRHHDMAIAAACMHQYAERMKQQATTTMTCSKNLLLRRRMAEQQAEYNVARAYHYVGLNYLAIPHYQAVLHASIQQRNQADILDKMQVDEDDEKDNGESKEGNGLKPSLHGDAEPFTSLQQEAAHNLAIIYQQSGANALARKLYMRYCRI